MTREKKGVRIDSSTVGTVVDMGIKDVYNMGAVMAPAAGDTIYKHLMNTKREAGYYDLILTGDLGIYGKKILMEYMKTEYNIDLKNYDDAASMIFVIYIFIYHFLSSSIFILEFLILIISLFMQVGLVQHVCLWLLILMF